MIEYQSKQLRNGLTVIAHQDSRSGMGVVNLLFDVGSRDEQPERTGFAHLFEHLMFGGSANIPDYDRVAQNMGAENNAFTSSDLTNYYISFPAAQLETALWLESDRMLQLDFSERSLGVQRQVVVEEYHQRYLNQPFGDAWLRLRALAYRIHPYRWATIGKEIAHIEKAELAEVEAFFYRHYRPNYAYLAVSGPYEFSQIFESVERWFGDIPCGARLPRNLPREPIPEAPRYEEVCDPALPADALYLAFPMSGRDEEGYVAADMLSDVLGRGRSARLYRRLVRDKQVFGQINAYVSGERDPGLLVLSGHPAEGVSIEAATSALWNELNELKSQPMEREEWQRQINQIEAEYHFGHVQGLNVALNLCYNALLGEVEGINRHVARYMAVEPDAIRSAAGEVFCEDRSSLLVYRR
ncbi:MAG: insulinase family protein [Sphingomonadales bacterium]|nr:insulinase family protein [Sphingomonadales bacterium]